MTVDFPSFDSTVPIDATRSWSAIFDSYDQRNEDCYYVVTLYEGGQESKRIMAQIALHADDGFHVPGFTDRLHQEIHAVAVTGKSNTAYRGSLADWIQGQR